MPMFLILGFMVLYKFAFNFNFKVNISTKTNLQKYKEPPKACIQSSFVLLTKLFISQLLQVRAVPRSKQLFVAAYLHSILAL